MKKTILLIAAAFLMLACDGYGEKVTYDGTEVYYKDAALKTKAEATGAYLQEMGFTDGSSKSVQITKDSIYNFRMVVQEGMAQDSTRDVNFMALGFLLSKDVFDGENIHFDLCDNTFETIRTIPIEGFNTETD
ncbi:hypothetical protein ACFQO1_03515 [Jejudonia soesokkakensis]|uniref:DUF4825 domain-containing protein n=1 Tax=Jejudonia soesokkakensis TaxID=1323432 RepID=A0ABW2MSR5_9FLAO